MISVKIFALNLLLISPLALARVQLNTIFEIKNSSKQSNRNIVTEVQLNADESEEVYSSQDIRIEAKLLANRENSEIVCYTIYEKNSAGEFEKTLEPTLVPAYGKDATWAICSYDGDKFSIILKTQKV